MTNSERHILELDGIRGIAISLVMAFHFFLFARLARALVPSQPGTAMAWFERVLASGWIGVDLFFVLSGFLITGILLDMKRNQSAGSYFANFYIRRTLRIFPLYYLFLLIWMLTVRFWESKLPSNYDPNYPFWLWAYLSNILIAQEGWKAIPLPIQHVWTLAIEEQFYLVWPLLIRFLKIKPAMILCALLVPACLALRFYQVGEGLTDDALVLTWTRLDAFAVGALLAMVLGQFGDARPVKLVCAFAGGIAAVFLLGLFVWQVGLGEGDAVVLTAGLSALALASAGIISTVYLLNTGSWVRRFLRSHALRFLGKYSYGLYMVHQPVAALFIATGALQWSLLTWVPENVLLRTMCLVIAPFAISLGIALLSWHLWEKHFMKFKKNFRGGKTLTA